MSVVTDIILTSAIESAERNDGTEFWPPADFLNDWLATHYREWARLEYVGDRSRGGKALQCDIWVGAFNHFPLSEFLAAVRAAPWESLDRVQVFVKEEEQEQFSERLNGTPA